jgi:hypothetical protein
VKTKTRTGKATVLLTLICYSLIAASACEQPPGRYAPPSSGIGGAEDLAKIGVDPDWPMDGAYTLGADITLTDWEPLGAYTNKFSGTFDGGNHTITIENGRGGLFAYASGAMIKNLKVAGTITVTEEGALQIGGVAGNIEGTIIENCASSIVIDAVGHGHNSAAAGIVGFMRDNSTVRSCSATGSVSLKTGPGEGLMIYAGGVAGYSGTGTAGEGSSGCLIVRSSWTGGAVYAEAGYPYAGGVVGYNYTGAKTVECFSAGSVTAKGENLPYAGGITGYNSGYVQDAIPPTPPVTVAVIENCYSTVRVSAEPQAERPLRGA